MTTEDSPVARAIRSRRSVRRFGPQDVDVTTIRRLVALACLAPAPHHSRPWRFVNVATTDARERLAAAMAAAWRDDLRRDGAPLEEARRLIERSHRQIAEAPVLLVACLSLRQAKVWPEGRRQGAERDMFVQSLGAALQNLLLAATEGGLAGYLKGAPLFCQEAVREALELPADWEPAFLVLLGYPPSGPILPAREPPEVTDLFLER